VKDLFSIDGKIALVTGGSRGIGEMIAAGFLASGAKVYISSRKADACEATAKRLALEYGGECTPLPADCSSLDGVEKLAAALGSRESRLDILVNNAGVGAGRPIADCDEAMWDAHADVNLKGLFFCCKAAIPELTQSKGNIVNIASDAGLMGVPGITIYCGTKGGVVNMTRAMALEIAPDVRVNCICPGYVDTDMIRVSVKKRADPDAAWQKMIDYAPLKRIASTDEIAHAVMYLASDSARFITGTSLAIDGGSTAGK